MSQTRWTCPFTCGSVLGPLRPRADHACRFCLVCSAMHVKHGVMKMVRRIPTTRERQKARKREEAKAAVAARRETAQAAWRRSLQEQAADYHVTFDGGGDAGIFDKLRGKGGALEAYRRLRKLGTTVTVARINARGHAVGVFHGARLAWWHYPDGIDSPLSEKERP